MEVDLSAGTQLIYMISDMVLNIDDFHSHIQVAIQTHGYDEWQEGESNLLITVGLVGRISNTSYIGFQYNVENVVDHLATNGITAIAGERRSINELEGMIWNLKPTTNTTVRIPARVQVSQRFDRSYDECFCTTCLQEAQRQEEEPLNQKRRGNKPPKNERKSREKWSTLGQPSGKWDYYVKYDSPKETTPIEQIIATVKEEDSDDGTEDEFEEEIKMLQIIASSGKKDKAEDEGRNESDHQKLNRLVRMIEEMALPSTEDSGSNMYNPPPEPVMGPPVYPPARDSQGMVKNYPYRRGIFKGGYGQYHDSQWTLPPAMTETGAMLVLPADPGMANNEDTNRSSSRRSATDDLTESRRRVHEIVAQVDAEMDRRARDAARSRHWGWLPTMIQEWIIGKRVPPYRYPGDTTPGHRLPPLGVPLEQAFAAHVACTRREIWRSGELSDEVRVLREKNDRLERRNDRLEERNDRLEEQVETLRLQVSQLMSQHGQMVDIMQEHDGRITENRVANEETQAMVQASDAMLNAWAAQFIEEPPQEDGPEFEVNDLGEVGFDEDPNEDPEEDDDDGDAASDISHVSMDSD
ncbi:hypothetical protein E3N88_30171 [Mikania micrantha]|uniref:Uncharacterized protein n=1 Tax=Mikania micrantha TaxID=192012 RepID=A0A5N6MLG1_9ASTR|nr:hypothetical protein E3N88_30171 [Mikania micrantha]